MQVYPRLRNLPRERLSLPVFDIDWQSIEDSDADFDPTTFLKSEVGPPWVPVLAEVEEYHKKRQIVAIARRKVPPYFIGRSFFLKICI